jgi:hypothetical protein
VTLVAYQLSERPAALIVDLAAASAGWRVVDQEVPVRSVLEIAPAPEVEALVRRALAEIRGHATAAVPPRSDLLRRLAAEIWRDFKAAANGGGEQQALPGVG